MQTSQATSQVSDEILTESTAESTDTSQKNEYKSELIGVGVALLIFSFVFNFSEFGRSSSSEIIVISVMQIFIRIAITVGVVNVAKKLNRISGWWGFFCIFIPVNNNDYFGFYETEAFLIRE